MVLVLATALWITLFGVLAQEEENEITRIINQTKIHCVSEFFNKPMFTSPPLAKIQDAQNLVEDGTWDDDDWVIINSNNTISQVEDKRWEDFKLTNETQYYRFADFKTSVSFSVTGTKEIEFFADDGVSLDYCEVSINNSEEWTTFTIFFKDNNLRYFKKNNFMRKYGFKPVLIEVKTAEPAYFKIHEYKFKSATNVTQAEQNPTSLTIPPFGKSSLVIYTSLCKSCVLEVQYGGHSKAITSNIKETDNFEQWQTYRIELNSSISNKINFVRRKNDSKEDGYWKLDVRLYDNEINTVTYDIPPNTAEPEKIHCKYFQPPNKSTNQRRKKNIDLTESSSDITKCPTGMVGPKCDIRCENVLGDQYPQCEKHKICYAKTCLCAWGYVGPHCDQECSTGFWGLDCKKECEGCRECNKQTWECEVEFEKTSLSSENNVSVGDTVQSWIFWGASVLMAIILIAGIFKTRSRKKPFSNKVSIGAEQIV